MVTLETIFSTFLTIFQLLYSDFENKPNQFVVTLEPIEIFQVKIYISYLQDGEKVLEMSQTQPHSKSRPAQMVGQGNLSFWIPRYIYISPVSVWSFLKFGEIWICKTAI